jgi:hypothetical protein
MSETPYSKREIDEKFEHVGDQVMLSFDSIKERLVAIQFDSIKERLVAIQEQVKKTNGRVSFLERSMWVAMGAIGVLSLSEVRGIISTLFG